MQRTTEELRRITAQSHEYRGREPFVLLWTWWRGDEQPPQKGTQDGIVCQETTDRTLMRQLMLLTPADVTHRFNAGHRAYIAKLGDQVVAFGWTAGKESAFGTPTTFFKIPIGNRYLYHFVTFLPWRGRGIYPRLLQSIIANEGAENERFWIMHRASNEASRRGIIRAGFQLSGRVYDLQSGKRILLAVDPDRAEASSQLLGLPLIREPES